MKNLSILLICLLTGFFWGKINKPLIEKNHKITIIKVAKNFSLEPEFIKAIILTESSGNPEAISRKGALGFMQLMPDTANELSNKLDQKEKDWKIPENNIILGCYYLHILLRRFRGDLIATLASYNAGPTRVNEWLNKYDTLSSKDIVNIKGSNETRTFVRRVMKRYTDSKE